MQKKDSLELLALKLELPREDSRNNPRYGRNRRDQKIEVGCVRQAPSLCPLRGEIEKHRSGIQSDREVNQHNMLGVLGK